MKKMILSLVIVLAIAACSKTKTFDSASEPSLSSEADSVSYMLGVEYGNWLKNMSPEEVNYEVFATALKAVIEGDSVYINDQARGVFLSNYFKRMDQLKMQKQEEEFAPRLKEQLAWLDQQVEEQGLTEVVDGVYYKKITAGTGEKPVDGDIVEVLYTGKTSDGKVFDSTEPSNETRKFSVNRVIPGWTAALKQMPVGSKWDVYIAPDMAYGINPDPRSGIQPNSTLIFTVELVGKETPEAAQ